MDEERCRTGARPASLLHGSLAIDVEGRLGLRADGVDIGVG
jgi:hypothetical protein